MKFPFLLGRAFIEADFDLSQTHHHTKFPFLLGRAFIEADNEEIITGDVMTISLPFGKGFH